MDKLDILLGAIKSDEAKDRFEIDWRKLNILRQRLKISHRDISNNGHVKSHVQVLKTLHGEEPSRRAQIGVLEAIIKLAKDRKAAHDEILDAIQTKPIDK